MCGSNVIELVNCYSIYFIRFVVCALCPVVV
jgi:hypothetical protein